MPRTNTLAYFVALKKMINTINTGFQTKSFKTLGPGSQTKEMQPIYFKIGPPVGTGEALHVQRCLKIKQQAFGQHNEELKEGSTEQIFKISCSAEIGYIFYLPLQCSPQQ